MVAVKSITSPAAKIHDSFVVSGSGEKPAQEGKSAPSGALDVRFGARGI